MATWFTCSKEQNFGNCLEKILQILFSSFSCAWLMASGSSSEKPANIIFMGTLQKKNSSSTNGEGLFRVGSSGSEV